MMIKQKKYIIVYSSSKAGTINERDIGDAFECNYIKHPKSIKKGSS